MLSVKKEICEELDHNKSEEKRENGILSSIRSSLTCPVCLDIFFSPFTCKPCEHVFCESCLRRVAKPCPTKTPCPLCRQLVASCEINHGYDKSVKMYFTNESKLCSRQEEIRLLKMSSPLPWMPNRRYYNTNQQQTFFEMIQALPANLWTSFYLSLPTIALLFFLHIVCIATFSLSYLGFSYIPSILVHWLLALFKAAGILSPVYEKEINIPALTPAWYATAVAIGISVVVWQKIRNN